MPEFIQRTTTSILAAALTGTAVLGIALGSAAAADAKPFTQSPDSLKMMCDRYGGSYIGKTKGTGAWCAWKDGSVTVCDEKDSCTIVEPAEAVRQDPGRAVQQPGGVLVAVG